MYIPNLFYHKDADNQMKLFTELTTQVEELIFIRQYINAKCEK